MWHVKFNAAKCQVLRITNKHEPTPGSYTIHGHQLELVDSAKYLGVHLDSKLNFNTHVDAVVKKANGIRAFLNRNIGHCGKKIKEASYKTYVRPIVEYSAAAWDPHAQRNIKKLEMVQRRSARYVTGAFDRRLSVKPMLQDLKWQSLEERRRLSRLEMMFRIRFDIIDINWSSYLIPLTTTTRGHQTRFMQQHCHIDGFAHSFFPRTTRDWNSLQCEPAAYPTINAFKTALRAELP